MYEDQWSQMLQYSYLNVWNEVSMLLPNIIAAILILIAGYIIAKVAKEAIIRLSEKLQVDTALHTTPAAEMVGKTGYKLNTGQFLGTVVKWFILIIFFILALDVLDINEATFFLTEVVLGYLPRILIAAIILIGGLLVSSVVERFVAVSAASMQFGQAILMGKLAKYAVVVFSVLAALNELLIATELVQMLFGGLVFALSLALGLSFGLGGRDAAARYIDRTTQNRL